MQANLDLINDSAKEFATTKLCHFIGGEWCESKSRKSFDIFDPATGQTFGDAPLGESAEVDAAVSAAQGAFENKTWAHLQSQDRAKILWKIADLIEENGETLAQLESLDNGKPLVMAKVADVALAAEHFRYYAGWCGKNGGRTLNLSVPMAKKNQFHAYTLKDPVGVVAQIIPWNFPLLMAAWKLAPALAAGCTVVLKPAEQTPLTATFLGRLMDQAGIPHGVVNIVHGDGSTGALLSAHHGVDKVAFTGSTEVGMEIVKAASGNLKKVSLELGGKSPNIVFADSDLDAAIKGAANGIFFNHGQCCSAGSRLYIEESVYDQVLDGVKALANKIKLGSGLKKETTMGPLVSKEQQERVSGYIKTGLSEGANVLCGGSTDEQPGYFVKPTVLRDTTSQMRVVKEEIFGPVLCAQKFSSEEEVASLSNESEFGLASGIWTSNLSKAHRLASKLRTGTVWINCYNVFDAALPFGGYKQSGWGREMGPEALELYTENKSVCVDLGRY